MHGDYTMSANPFSHPRTLHTCGLRMKTFCLPTNYATYLELVLKWHESGSVEGKDFYGPDMRPGEPALLLWWYMGVALSDW